MSDCVVTAWSEHRDEQVKQRRDALSAVNAKWDKRFKTLRAAYDSGAILWLEYDRLLTPIRDAWEIEIVEGCGGTGGEKQRMNEHQENPELQPGQLSDLIGGVVIDVRVRVGLGNLWTVHGDGNVELLHSDVGGVVEPGLYVLTGCGGTGGHPMSVCKRVGDVEIHLKDCSHPFGRSLADDPAAVERAASMIKS
ncbi:hypothetical protein LCGC14_3101860, partial [marine sediment metagenome]